MTTSDKLREIAEKYFPTEERLSNYSLYNQLQQSNQDNLLSDLTALISEHYVPKDDYDKLGRLMDQLAEADEKQTSELLRQRDELREENKKLKKQLWSQNPYPDRPNPRDVNPYDSKAIKRTRRC